MPDAQITEAITRLALAIDEVAGMAAANAAYIAHLPGADTPDIETIKTMAVQLCPQGAGTRPAPQQHAMRTIGRIQELAQTLEVLRSSGQ